MINTWSMLLNQVGLLTSVLLFASCVSKPMVVDNSDEILANKEYEAAIKVDDAPSGTTKGLIETQPVSTVTTGTKLPKSVARVRKNSKTSAKEKGATKSLAKKSAAVIPIANSVAQPPASAARQPEIEDSTGFNGRRPEVDPFRVGEATTLELSYFGVAAGDMTLEVRPHKTVNGRKSYHFVGVSKSSSVFSVFYAVDDWVETFVDFENLIPFNYSLHVKETKQLREVRSFFDWKSMNARVWDKKIGKDKGPEEKNYEWAILPFSQNVFSTPFYIRTFKLEPGKKIQFRIGHEGKNLVMTTEVLRREKLKTDIGEFKTIVIRPTITLDGVFKPMGDLMFWLTDDDRKFIVRIESKIKIGKIVGKLKKIVRGDETTGQKLTQETRSAASEEDDVASEGIEKVSNEESEGSPAMAPAVGQ